MGPQVFVKKEIKEMRTTGRMNTAEINPHDVVVIRSSLLPDFYYIETDQKFVRNQNPSALFDIKTKNDNSYGLNISRDSKTAQFSGYVTTEDNTVLTLNEDVIITSGESPSKFKNIEYKESKGDSIEASNGKVLNELDIFCKDK